MEPSAKDNRIVSRIKAGNRDAFDLLTQEYGRRLYSFIYRMTGRHELTDEILQETFIRAFRNIADFKSGRLISWLNRIAYNLCIDMLNSSKSRRSREDNYFEDNIAIGSAGNEVEVAVIKKDMMKRLNTEMKNLPEKQRAAIILFAAGDYSIRETAEIMGCSEGAVMSHLHRAREKLRMLISKNDLRTGGEY